MDIDRETDSLLLPMIAGRRYGTLESPPLPPATIVVGRLHLHNDIRDDIQYLLLLLRTKNKVRRIPELRFSQSRYFLLVTEKRFHRGFRSDGTGCLGLGSAGF